MTKKELTREQYHKGLIGKVPKKWHKEMLEEFDKDMLEEQLMEMPELEEHEIAKMTEQEKFENGYLPQEELIHKRMNDINTFQAHENEVYLRGTDEDGKDFQICFDSYNFLEWIDTEHLKYIKKQLIKY
jgi:hypothetical protein